MAITRIGIEAFIEMAGSYLVLDVRSPAEYAHAHIPGAYSLPLFTDEERKIVGTTYKQQGREDAIKAGLDFFGPRMRQMVEAAERLLTRTSTKFPRTVLVHCWRGGMRSAGVAWLLDLYGFKVYTLAGGYKSFRNWVLAAFSQKYPFKIIGGYTGSGKTLALTELETAGEIIIDLESIAKHKGSAFGEIKGVPQPGQEMFENILAAALHEAAGKAAVLNKDIWMEDESQRIGLVNLPNDLWKTMRTSPVYFLNIPFEERLGHIVQEYGDLEKERLVNAIIRIQKRLGGLDMKTAINYLLEDNIKESFRVLLKYYDKQYNKALQGRENLAALLHNIDCMQVDARENSKKLITPGAIA